MKNLLIIFIAGLVLISCGKRDGFEFKETLGNDFQLEEERLLTFEDLKRRILAPHCMTCHKRSGTAEGIEKWIIAGDPENSKLFKVIKDGSMPKKADPLPIADLEFVRKYILDLATIRNLETIDFVTLKNEILVPYCLNCHKKMDNEESLKRWINMSDPMNSRLLQTVVEGKMPKKGPPLNDSELMLIKKYLNNFLK
ncbi:MAG: hypothetical protein WDA09_00035 [Bacteriovoracaceae bacterium]